MKTIYRLNTEDYKPISYKDNYLYEQHKRIVSFLKSRLDSSKIRKILKPKLASTTLEWQGDFDVEMRPIDHASSEEKVKIEKEYLALIEEVEKLIKRMKNSGDADQIEWANFLAQVFRVENNMIVYEGKDWAFIWGWEFKSKLTILNPDFVGIPDSTVTEAVTEPDPQPGPEVEEIIIVDPPWPPPPPPPVKARRLTFFDYIRLFLRWFTYRFWALMLLILLILLIICLCRRCCREEIDCSDFNNKIGLLDNNLNSCCNSADTRNNITEIPNNPELPNYPVDNDTIIDNVLVQKPTENCRAFFSGRLVTDDPSYNESVIFQPNDQSEYVGAGDYPRASRAFPNSDRHTFDGIAIGRNTRVIIYEKKDFQGRILIDVQGPAIINNGKWKGTSLERVINEINTKRLNGNLESIFPKTCRKFSESDMHPWSNGSLKVLCTNN